MNDQMVDRRLVVASAAAEGLVLDSDVVDRLVTFGDLFLQWNQRINLGGRIGPRDLVEQHFADAFAARRFVEGASDGVDVGTGGGLPAVPLVVICPELRMEMWEPTAKKVSFLRTAVRELRLGARVTVNAGRMDAENAGRLGRAYDLATSRATFAPLDWLVLGRHLIGPGGKVLVFATDELPDGCPEPRASYRYRDNRQLLVFGQG